MLLCQNLRGGHQGALPAVSGRAVGSRSSHHGLAAAHVALDKAVHGGTLPEIPENFFHRPLLGTGQGKGQAPVKQSKIRVRIGSGFLFRAGSPHQRQTSRENEELLKNQPFLGQLCLCHGGGLMDGRVGSVRIRNAIALPNLRRQNFRRRITDGQGLPHSPKHRGVVQSRGQRINGQNPPGSHRLGIQRFKHRIRHAVADKISGYRTIEYVFSAINQLVGHIAIIKEGHIQPSRVVRNLYPGDIQALANMGGSGSIHDHGLKAGRYIRLQLFNGNQLCPVLIASWKMADQIPEGENI